MRVSFDINTDIIDDKTELAISELQVNIPFVDYHIGYLEVGQVQGVDGGFVMNVRDSSAHYCRFHCGDFVVDDWGEGFGFEDEGGSRVQVYGVT